VTDISDTFDLMKYADDEAEMRELAQVKKQLKEAYEQGKGNPIIMPPQAPVQQKIPRSTLIPVDTSLPTREYLNGLKTSIEDNVEVLRDDLKRLADEYDARETELDRLKGQIKDLKKCIEALDNEGEG